MNTSIKHLLFVPLLMATSAFAQIDLENPTVTGSGCPVDTSSISVAPDGASISILFDNFAVEVPYETPSGLLRTIQSKICNIKLPITIPENHLVESIKFNYDLRGYTFTDPSVKASFSSILVSATGMNRADAGSRPRMKKLNDVVWKDNNLGIDEDWTLSHEIDQPINSSCAYLQNRTFKVILKNVLSAAMSKRLLADGFTGLATLDSADVQSNLQLQVNLKKCDAKKNHDRKRRDRGQRRTRRGRG
jgi:hypothetical protein